MPRIKHVKKRPCMDSATMERALNMLDEEISHSEALSSIAPIVLVTAGGSVAVGLFFNRQYTHDMECMLPHSLVAEPAHVEQLCMAVDSVALRANLSATWLNRRLEDQVPAHRHRRLFRHAVRDGRLLYDGPCLTVYAAPVPWMLQHKMHRVAFARDRRASEDEDVSDAAALVHDMINEQGYPVTTESVRSLDFGGDGVRPLSEEALDEVGSHYVQTYDAVGLVDTVWDRKTQQCKYIDLDGKWAYF